MSCFSNPSSTGSQCRVTGISDSSMMVGMPAAATLMKLEVPRTALLRANEVIE